MKRRGAFDLLLHLQLSIRASATAACIPAPIKLGFDKPRARELQWLFTNRRIAERSREHVLDSFLGFADALGVPRLAPRWDIPLPPAARAYAEQLIPDAQPTLLISACSSHRARNWLPERYAAVADHAARNHGMRVILCGGPAVIEREMAAAIAKHAACRSSTRWARTRCRSCSRCWRAPPCCVTGLRSRAHGHHGGHARHRSVRGH